MKYWKDLFKGIILKRGSDYYENGNVSELKGIGGGYSAIVDGSDSYDVEIDIDNGEVSDMYCSCPYAQEGNNCKHMAAVLFAIDNLRYDYIKPMEKKDVYDKNELMGLINKIPESEIRRILFDLANENHKLSTSLMLKYSDNVSDEVINQLKNEVDKIAVDNSDGYGYVGWNNTCNFVNEMQEFLDEKVKALIDKNRLKQSFELTNYVFHCVGNIDIDDSEGETSYIADKCYEYWKQILEKAGEDLKKDMHEWFENHQNKYVIDYIEEYVQEFLEHEFCNTEKLKEQLKSLDKIIDKADKGNDCGSIYSSYYGYENVVLKRIVIMSQLGYSKKDIEKFKKQNRHFWVIRESEIKDYLDEQNYDKAVEVLKESKDIDQNYRDKVTEYSRQLIDIYNRTGNKIDYKNELYYQVFSCQQNDLNYIKRLKAVSSEDEWNEYQEKILNLNLINPVRFSFLELEELYEQLLSAIMQGGTIFDVDHYEDVLRNNLPDRTKNVYINYVIKEADRVCDRHGYEHLMIYLKKIAKFPEGRKEAVKIANSWKMEYRRRRAMMDELKKAGF